MFNWIRTMVRNAVLSGINDAVAELCGISADPPVELLIAQPEEIVFDPEGEPPLTKFDRRNSRKAKR